MLEGNYTIKEVIKDDVREYFIQDGTKVFKLIYKPRKSPKASPLYIVSLAESYVTGVYPFKENQSLEPSKINGWYKGDFKEQKYTFKVRGRSFIIEKFQFKNKAK